MAGAGIMVSMIHLSSFRRRTENLLLFMIKKMEKHRFSEMKIESPDSHTARNKGNICFAGSIAYLSLESKGGQDKL